MLTRIILHLDKRGTILIKKKNTIVRNYYGNMNTRPALHFIHIHIENIIPGESFNVGKCIHYLRDHQRFLKIYLLQFMSLQNKMYSIIFLLLSIIIIFFKSFTLLSANIYNSKN